MVTLMGGLYMFFLKRIRGETTTVETAFSGFSNRFLHLFLAYFVSFALIALGFICLILPGIFLSVAWFFAIPLVIDKGLDFWSAMEVSRKVVCKHWWKFLWLVVLLLLLRLAGLMVFFIGIFIALPIVKAAKMYAYEDLFGKQAGTAKQPPPVIGPLGTEVHPSPASPPAGGSKGWKWAVSLLAIVACVIFIAVLKHQHMVWANHQLLAEQQRATARAQFASLRQRITQELNDESMSFTGLAVARADDGTFVVSFSQLQKAVTNHPIVFENVMGSLVADRIGHDTYEFRGQNALQNVQFQLANIDLDNVLRHEEDADGDDVAGPAGKFSPEMLSERLEAVSVMSNARDKDRLLGALALDAARAGQPNIIKDSLRQISNLRDQNTTALEAARLLAEHGLRKQAIESQKTLKIKNP